ncbi:hypothetical protein HYU18_01930, partial [Candidatus Woesearchaeota archaeon]|nr:hypothetical protein [Candidatus Woesearchaeota archaeon]
MVQDNDRSRGKQLTARIRGGLDVIQGRLGAATAEMQVLVSERQVIIDHRDFFSSDLRPERLAELQSVIYRETANIRDKSAAILRDQNQAAKIRNFLDAYAAQKPFDVTTAPSYVNRMVAREEQIMGRALSRDEAQDVAHFVQKRIERELKVVKRLYELAMGYAIRNNGQELDRVLRLVDNLLPESTREAFSPAAFSNLYQAKQRASEVLPIIAANVAPVLEEADRRIADANARADSAYARANAAVARAEQAEQTAATSTDAKVRQVRTDLSSHAQSVADDAARRAMDHADQGDRTLDQIIAGQLDSNTPGSYAAGVQAQIGDVSAELDPAVDGTYAHGVAQALQGQARQITGLRETSRHHGRGIYGALFLGGAALFIAAVALFKSGGPAPVIPPVESTPTPAATATYTPSAIATATPTSGVVIVPATPTATYTPVPPTPTYTAVPPAPTATSTATPQPTATSLPTATATPRPVATPTATVIPTPTQFPGLEQKIAAMRVQDFTMSKELLRDAYLA